MHLNHFQTGQYFLRYIIGTKRTIFENKLYCKWSKVLRNQLTLRFRGICIFENFFLIFFNCFNCSLVRHVRLSEKKIRNINSSAWFTRYLLTLSVVLLYFGTDNGIFVVVQVFKAVCHKLATSKPSTYGWALAQVKTTTQST